MATDRQRRSELHRADPKAEDQSGWEVAAAVAGRVIGDHLYASVTIVVALLLVIAHSQWMALVVVLGAVLLWKFTRVRHWTDSWTLRRRISRSFEQVAVHLPPLADRHGRLPDVVAVRRIAHGIDVVVRLPAGVVPVDLERSGDALVHGLANAVHGLQLHGVRVLPADKRGQVVLRLLESDPLDQVVGSDELQPFVLGRLETGEPFRWDPVRAPHWLVVGDPGAGKSSLLRAFLYTLPTDFLVGLIDPKVVEFGQWPVQGRIQTVAADLEHARDDLMFWLGEMQARLEVMAAHGLTDWTELSGCRPAVIVFDEVASALGDTTKAAKGLVEEIKGALQQLVLKARAAGISVILGLQRPDAYVLGGLMRDNVRGRIALGRLSGDGCQMTFEDQGVKDLLGGGPGYGVAWCMGDGTDQPVRIRSHFVDRQTCIARLTAAQ